MFISGTGQSPFILTKASQNSLHVLKSREQISFSFYYFHNKHLHFLFLHIQSISDFFYIEK